MAASIRDVRQLRIIARFGMAKLLTLRANIFVDAYCGVAAGNQAEAARIAGYKGRTTDALSEQGRRLLQRADVRAAIEAKVAADPLVKDGEALRRFWSDVVDGKEIVETKNGRKRRNSPELKDRLKASELLAKANGLFVKQVKVEHGGVVRVEAVLPENGRDERG